MTERFIVSEQEKSWLSSAYLESDPKIVLKSSRSPVLDGARLLLGLGYDPQTLLTTRRKTGDFDNWVPAAIGDLAKWSTSEPDKGRLNFVPYQKDMRFK